ncbi:MAG: ABC-F family ATP-binding cassette domain-containing protein [Deltaproteobacteria bacterium]|nr:ABC-F family ATP-binding cassette domain-containing protein [Deltaproteobacteria bacterium]
MSLVVLEDVSLFFGERCIVDELGLRVAAGDRIGIIGPNGSGKTTILRLIAGEQAPDSGTIRTSTGVRIGYLPQDIAIAGGAPLLSFVLASVPGREQLKAQALELETELAARGSEGDVEETMELAMRLAELHEELTHFEIHFTEHAARRILSGLGFSTEDGARDIGELSGGWKMRAVLAALLFQRPDVLLLDEPTNHLDMPSVAWFAGFLKRYEGAFLLISHDREFLNEQIRRCLTFEPEGVRQYKGNYEEYLRLRQEELVILQAQAKNLAKKKEKTQLFIDRFRSKASKATQVQSKIKQLAKMGEVHVYETHRSMRFTFPPSARAGNEPLTVKNLAKSYGDLSVFREVDLTVARGERIGIIGVNGAGKTTLLRVMADEVGATAGTVELGHNVKVSYYAQHHAETLDKSRTVFEEVYGHSQDAGVTRVRSLLGAFLFSGDDVDKKISVLSGGERARVALAKMLVDPGNLMLMDEPTNHLDLASSEALAEALSTYDGTLIFVSHNRAFVRRLATRIWDVAEGRVETYPGTLDEYMYAMEERDEASSSPAKPQGGGKAMEANADVGKTRKRNKADEKDRKRREAEIRQLRSKKLRPLEKTGTELEARIAELEDEQKRRATELEDPEVYGDEKRRFTLLADLQTAQDKLDQLTERWTGVAEQLEAAEAELAVLEGRA